MRGLSNIFFFLVEWWLCSFFFFFARDLLVFLCGQTRLVSRHSQVHRKGQMQAMAMEVHYKLCAAMGVYLGLDLIDARNFSIGGDLV